MGKNNKRFRPLNREAKPRFIIPCFILAVTAALLAFLLLLPPQQAAAQNTYAGFAGEAQGVPSQTRDNGMSAAGPLLNSAMRDDWAFAAAKGLAVSGLLNDSNFTLLGQPFLAPAPLAEVVPDSATSFISFDIVNTSHAANDYIDALGRERVTDLFKEPGDNGFNASEAFGLARDWITREILVFSIGESGQKKEQSVILIGSHDAAKAEKDFPKMLEMMMKKKTGYGEAAYETTSGDTVNMHCPEPQPGAGTGDGFCWASTDTAIVISSNRDAVRLAVDSIYGGRTDMQKYLGRISTRDISQQRVLYIYLSPDGLGEFIDSFSKGSGGKPGYAGDTEQKPVADCKNGIRKNNCEILDELAAVKGLTLALTFNGLSPQLNARLMLDQSKVNGAKYISAIMKFEPGEHKIDGVLYRKDTIAYISMNNFDKFMSFFQIKLDERNQGGYEGAGDMATGGITGVLGKVREHLKATRLNELLGGEFGLSLIDIKLVRDASFPIVPKIVGMLELSEDEDSAGRLIAYIKRWIESENKNLEDENLKDERDKYSFTPVLKKTGTAVYEAIIPDLEALSPASRLLIGVSGGYIYLGFGLDQREFTEFMSGASGRPSGVSSLMKLIVNVPMLMDFVKSWIDGEKIGDYNAEIEKLKQTIDLVKTNPDLKDADKAAAIKDSQQEIKAYEYMLAVEKKNENLLMTFLGALGAMKIAVNPGQDAISAELDLDVSAEKLKAIPDQAFSDIKEVSAEKEKQTSFNSCYGALDNVASAIDKYGAETGYETEGPSSFAGIDKSGDAVAKYFPGLEAQCAEKGSCMGLMGRLVDEACEPGSFAVEKAAEDDYVIKAASRVTGCMLCVGLGSARNYSSYGECVVNPGKTCADLAF